MIIYGKKSTQLVKEHLTDKCSNCGTQNSIDLYLFQNYAHVFWIPFFATGKSAVSECSHCKQVLKQKEMPVDLLEQVRDLKRQYKTPVWTFSGLGLFALLIVVLVINDKNKSKKNIALLAASKVGDVLQIRTKEKQYTLYKIDEVATDSVFLRYNNYECNKISGLADIKLKGDTAYSEDLLGYSKTELKKMLMDGEIIDIER